MEIETGYKLKGKFRQYNQALDKEENKLIKSLILHSGKTDEEIEAVWAFITEALSKDIDIICRNCGYYVISRDVYGSVPHNTYECMTENEKDIEIILELIKKWLGKWA